MKNVEMCLFDQVSSHSDHLSVFNPIQTGGGLKYPQRQKCLQNSENRKKFKKTTTNTSNPLIEAAL